MGHYAAYSGNFLPTFRDKLPVPSSRVKNRRPDSRHLKMGPKSCPEAIMCCAISHKSSDRIYFATEARNHTEK